MSRYVRPLLDYQQSTVFTCPHCGVLATHYGGGICLHPQMQVTPKATAPEARGGVFKLTCSGCGESSIFFKEKLVYPQPLTGPMPIDGMPEDVRADYEEARRVAECSPRSAAALLRLAVQKLCKHLGESGKNINDDIAELVKKGLSSDIQRALDIVRVVGNNAVHPGELDLNDSPAICTQLFVLLNLIVERMIIEPKRISEAFSSLPPSSLSAIQKRDNP
jgi:Domain of unknown function (DUF4145)